MILTVTSFIVLQIHCTDMWQLAISVNKCCILNIGNPKMLVNMNINNSVLPQPSSVLYLGLTVTSN